MAPTQTSRRDVFRRIAQRSTLEWPSYDSTPFYDRQSLGGIEQDVRTVAAAWFDHDAHGSVDEFVCHLPLAYVDFQAYDRYSGTTRYGMSQLLRAFLLKELHGWDHETALVEYFQRRPELRRTLGFETVPDQSTLWRSWRCRFPTELRETIEKAARIILIRADRAGVSVPREPPTTLDHPETDEESQLDDQTLLDQAAEITDQVGRLVYPAFSLDRGEGCEIHEHAFWDLQTYLGLREHLAANEGPRSFVHESQRERTPLGHAHREHIRDLSVDQIREMYHHAVERLIDCAAKTDEFYRAGIVAIDTTEADPFTGDRTGHEDEIVGTKEKTDEYAYQWATVQLVGNVVPLVLDARPVKKGDSRTEIVDDLLDTAQELVHVDEVLMDREFDSQHVLKAVSDRGLKYVVPQADADQREGPGQATAEGGRELLHDGPETPPRQRRVAANDAGLQTQGELRADGLSPVCGVHDECFSWGSQRVQLPLGDRERLQIDQAVHGCHYVEEFRASILLLRFRLFVVLDLASGRSTRSGRVDWRV